MGCQIHIICLINIVYVYIFGIKVYMILTISNIFRKWLFVWQKLSFLLKQQAIYFSESQ